MAASRILSLVAGGPGLPATGQVQAGPVVDPLDLAVLRGEGVFETLRVFGRRPFRLAEHLARLARSAAAVAIDLARLDVEKLAVAAVEAAVVEGGIGADGAMILRIVCTKGREDADPSTPAAYASCFEPPAGLDADRARGLRLVLLTTATDPLVRAASPWLLPAVKPTSYAVSMAAQRAANARGADDAILTGLGGELLEAPTANLWWRSGDTLFTPTLALGVLEGITRGVLIELAGPLGWRVVEGVFTAEDLLAADEAFLSSSVREVMPVVEVDGQPIGDGDPGPAAAKLQAGLRQLATGAAPGEG